MDRATLRYVLATFLDKNEMLTTSDIVKRLRVLPGPNKCVLDTSALARMMFFSHAFKVVEMVSADKLTFWSLAHLDPKHNLWRLTTDRALPMMYEAEELEPGWFTATVTCGPNRYDGFGRTEEQAKENAARIALAAYGIDGPDKDGDVIPSHVRAVITKWAAEAHPTLSKEMTKWLEDNQ
jgi:hypothetical protein